MTELLLLLGLGTCGFLLQFLLTAGLSYVPPPSVMEEREKEVGGVLGGEDVGVGDVDVDVGQDGVVGEVGEVVGGERVLGGGEGGEAATQRGSSEAPKKTEENAKPSSSSSTHGSKATSMVYTQMLFALLYDKLVFNATPSPVSWAGSAIILGSAIYVALVKERGKDAGAGAVEGQRDGGEGNGQQQSKHARSWNPEDARLAEAEEGRGLLADYDDDDDDYGYGYGYDDYDSDNDNGGGGSGNGNGNRR
ncbi:hypothetical protein EMPG_13079 [Blastomyces silverae]|uniref:EamA domain-containing protein n=1 Tax=Blastomyces silverae TaxID=2060906 RepID=A0A0H1BKV9_9EURO|nr:hypothetical protein EMPG_13079 [Blastomyces silverae]